MRAGVLLLALACAGCSPVGTRSPPPSALTVVLPIDFPVLEGAVPMPRPADDPGLIALWESDRQGSAAFDFYTVALPAAGYGVIGLYPGGEVALIRFVAEPGVIWQVVIHGAADGRVAIEVRLDRP
jgi:hypothetical protein